MKKKGKQNCRIFIRCTEEEKAKFEQIVEQRGTSQRACFMNCIDESIRKEKRDNREKQKILKCACILQNAVNELDDSELQNKIREEIGELWDML